MTPLQHLQQLAHQAGPGKVAVAVGVLALAGMLVTGRGGGRVVYGPPPRSYGQGGGRIGPLGALLLLLGAAVAISMIRGHAAGAGPAAHGPAPARAQLTGAVSAAGPAACGCTVTTMPGNPNEQLANRMAARAGFGTREQSCLDLLWTYESAHTWSPGVTNPTSGAMGIPQSYPAGKMASAGADWQTSAATQIRWGLDYIAGRYRTPCGAWHFELANNSY